MVTRKIEQRDEIEVYVSQSGYVCIKQTSYPDGENIILVPPQDVPRLIEHLQATYTDALDFEPEMDEEEIDE